MAIYERFNNIDITTTTLADIVEMLKERRDLYLTGAGKKNTLLSKSSTDESD